VPDEPGELDREGAHHQPPELTMSTARITSNARARRRTRMVRWTGGIIAVVLLLAVLVPAALSAVS
jgi:hypothetical protein